MNKIKTGIEGLDKALQGGIPEGNIVLISGGAGTGKSTLCLQILVNSAKSGEKSLYISTEQTREEIGRMAENFGWNLNDLEKKNLFEMHYFDTLGGSANLLRDMKAIITKFKPKRIVIDSLTTLTDGLLVSDLSEQKEFSVVQVAESLNPVPRSDKLVTKALLYALIKALKKFKITTIMTTELFQEDKQLSADGVSEFIADGIIVLFSLGIAGSNSEALRVAKMRYTDHLKSYLPFSITDKGVDINPDSGTDILMK